MIPAVSSLSTTVSVVRNGVLMASRGWLDAKKRSIRPRQDTQRGSSGKGGSRPDGAPSPAWRCSCCGRLAGAPGLYRVAEKVPEEDTRGWLLRAVQKQALRKDGPFRGG